MRSHPPLRRAIGLAVALAFVAAGAAIRAADALPVTERDGVQFAEALGFGSGTTLGYGPDDSILYDVSLSTGDSLTLARDLSTSGYITIDDMSTALTSSGHAITAGHLDVGNGAALSLDQNLSISTGSL